MSKLPEWGHDDGKTFTVRLRCINAWCDEYGSVWRSKGVEQYGATELQEPECPVCAQPGEVQE